jgi:hypothetical protein
MRWLIERGYDYSSVPPVTKLIDGASASSATNAGKFASLFVPYYNRLMPSWRSAKGMGTGKRAPGKDKDFHQWKKLGRGGQNGVSLIVLGLAWWFNELNPNAEGNAEDSGKYTVVVEDCIWVLDRLLIGAEGGLLTWVGEEEESSVRGSRKRVAPDMSADPVKKNKK